MKKIKLIYSIAFLAVVTIISCTKKDGIDNDLSFLNTAASGNLAKIFDISTDNSGNVKVTPTGNGVTSSTINFGHGTGAAGTATVTAGGNATHTYPEGTYTVTIISTDIAGKQTTSTYPLTVTYRAPENLLPNKSTSRNGAAVKPTALYAASYRVDFGDGTAILPIAYGAMENHIYAVPGTYNVKVTALSGNALYTGAATKDTTFPVVIAPPPAAPFALPITFDDAAVSYFFGSFGGGQAFSTVANPNASGLNTTASVGRFTRGWDSWSGTYSPLNLLMDFGVTKKIKLWAYNPDPALIGKTINLELESALGGSPGNGVGVKKVAFTTSGAWEELVFDYSTITNLPANAKFAQIVFRFNDSYSGAGVGGLGSIFYIDNIRLTN
jgi:hypothetical protein